MDLTAIVVMSRESERERSREREREENKERIIRKEREQQGSRSEREREFEDSVAIPGSYALSCLVVFSFPDKTRSGDTLKAPLKLVCFPWNHVSHLFK